MEEPVKILQKYWKHDSFRPLQEEIIQKVSANQDVLALLPTGGGKSLCFQIPALLRPGICIVVSPLVALMEDQVSALKEKGIKALSLTGGIPFSELDSLLDNCIYGNYKFLYLSPERLQQDIVQQRIRQMKVNLIAVDEAHCISQWGHDFRPAYRNIRILRELQPTVNFIGLTASATEPVIRDIVAQLDFREPAIVKKSFERKNIAYSVYTVADKRHRLEQLISQHDQAVIIYTMSRRATSEISHFLEKKGYTATFYNGGISKKDKSKRLKQWLTGDKRIMVATSAFGMGIDKANVRTVVHMDLPESLESYFQQAGRAGRDEIPAKAVILSSDGDILALKNQYLKTFPDVAFVKLVYKKLMAYFKVAYGEGEGAVFNFNFAAFCQKYQLPSLKTYNTLQLLDRASVLHLAEQYQKKTRIQFLSTSRRLSFFLQENTRYEKLVKTILRTYGGAFDNKVDIDLAHICSKTGHPQEDALKLLARLDSLGLAELEQDIHDATVTILVPREDETTINPLGNYIREQARVKKEKIVAVADYVRNETCKSELLLRYFGETEVAPCGICSVCKPVEDTLTREKMKLIYQAIVRLLEQRTFSLAEITARLDFEEHHILKVLQLLVQKGALSLTPTKTYKLKHL